MTKTRLTSTLGTLALGALAVLGSALQPAAAQAESRTLCIYDPIGANGFIYESFQDYVVQARSWGIKLDTRAYTDEAVAAKDFKAGECDMAAVTGIRTIQFVKFAGSLDMAGGLQTYEQEKTAIEVMSSPKAADYMKQDGYEVVGVVPLGKAFLFSSDKRYLDSLDTAEIVEQIEKNVGNDLQYIRINGTLVGGLIGLAIHVLTQLLPFT